MGQEFVIKSTTLEDKINQLLPSQGGAQAGVDLSASTTIIPIIDLTESAEGSGLRQDLQSALSHDVITAFSVNNATNTVLVNTTGYFRVFGVANIVSGGNGSLNLFDSATSKNLFLAGAAGLITYDFIVFIAAGDSLRCTASSNSSLIGNTRQIADISGNLVNP